MGIDPKNHKPLLHYNSSTIKSPVTHKNTHNSHTSFFSRNTSFTSSFSAFPSPETDCSLNSEGSSTSSLSIMPGIGAHTSWSIEVVNADLQEPGSVQVDQHHHHQQQQQQDDPKFMSMSYSDLAQNLERYNRRQEDLGHESYGFAADEDLNSNNISYNSDNLDALDSSDDDGMSALMQDQALLNLDFLEGHKRPAGGMRPQTSMAVKIVASPDHLGMLIHCCTEVEASSDQSCSDSQPDQTAVDEDKKWINPSTILSAERPSRCQEDKKAENEIVVN
ncbi:hypothetical protein SELMODRAFT_415247 [Selaginella moellendorffii]|uniref:Uncharacterized protein n=1 Tax=Selaginella moellendorffii TaxID=88036 RepID=D8RVH6_SELML|nr:hypothetical protein SELMODRAFT_415247 [Selaginella moellendorffii]